MLGQRVKKMILVRLLLATLLLYCPQVFAGMSAAAFFKLALLIGTLSGGYLIWHASRRRLKVLALLQIVVDVLIETYLVCMTGGAESPFSILYVLSILGTALIVSERRIVTGVTVFISLAYVGGSLTQFIFRSPTSYLGKDLVSFLYVAALHVMIFILTGLLSRRLNETVRELQEKLSLSERLSALGEVVSKIAHEVRNPLSTIRTAADILGELLRGKMGEQEERMLKIIEQESNRLTQTLQRILNYTRQVQPNPHSLNLDSMMERVLSMARMNPSIHSNGILVKKKYDALKCGVYIDEEQAVSIFLNLILNAFQAMPQGGVLEVLAKEDAQGTEISIRDSGSGIPRDKMAHLFTPFKTSKKAGTGIGLAEVHKLVTLHEGRIRAESKQGEGAVFHVYFPKP